MQGQSVPDRNEEIFLYQTLIGMWPFAPEERATVLERLQAYAVKATREAKVHTRWTLPNLEHEEALKQFIAQIVVPDDRNAFFRDFTVFHDRIAHCAMVNGLGQTLLKIISRGVPDFYQGSEFWDFRLVDPGNRQPVDFAERKAALASMQGAKQSPCVCLAEDLAKNWRDGKIKMYVIWKALGFRRQNTEPFLHGEFTPLVASGVRQENISAYARRHGKKALLVVLPRWLAAARASDFSMAPQEFWADTHVPLSASDPRFWRNVFTGETVSVSQATSPTHSLRIGELLRHFPVAMLEALNS